MSDDSNTAEVFLEKKVAFGWIKLVCGVTSAGFFGYGCRAAYRQARPFKPNEISRKQILSGMGFAARALTIATIITCSGYALFVITVTTALGVSTPTEFGAKVKELCGNRLRLPGSEKSQDFEEIFK